MSAIPLAKEAEDSMADTNLKNRIFDKVLTLAIQLFIMKQVMVGALVVVIIIGRIGQTYLKLLQTGFISLQLTKIMTINYIEMVN